MQRWLVWFGFLLTCFWVGQNFSPVSVLAQDAAEPAAEAAAPAVAAPAPAAGGAAATPAPAAPKESNLMWIIKTSGWIGGFLLILSIYFIATCFKLVTEYQAAKIIPPSVEEQCASSLEKRDLKGLYAVVKEDNSEYSRFVRAGIAELPSGLSEARTAMDRTADVVHSEGERKISMLAVLGTLGPMIGLLGTLKGMIGAFAEIAQSEGGQMKASKVAGEISHALLLTFEGVLLSVPAIFLHAVFRNRITHLGDQAFIKAEELVTKVASMAKRPSSAPASTAAAPPPPSA
jgi:biopolymer transport protein ExbB